MTANKSIWNNINDRVCCKSMQYIGVSISKPSMKHLTPKHLSFVQHQFCSFIHNIRSSEDSHSCSPAVVLGIDYDCVRKRIGIDGGDWRDMVLMSVDSCDNSHSSFKQHSLHSFPDLGSF